MSRSFWLFGARFTVHANHEDTAGRYDLIEGDGPPGFQSPLHRHTRYAEQFYILEGEFTVWAGRQTAGRAVRKSPQAVGFARIG